MYNSMNGNSCPSIALQCPGTGARLPPLAHLRPNHKYNSKAKACYEGEQYQHVSVVVVRPKPKQLRKQRTSALANGAPARGGDSPSA